MGNRDEIEAREAKHKAELDALLREKASLEQREGQRKIEIANIVKERAARELRYDDDTENDSNLPSPYPFCPCK